MQRVNHRHVTGRRASLFAVAVLGVTLLTAGAPAVARSGKGAVSGRSKRALGHFLKGEYEQALKLYRQAHGVSKAPKHLYNIGLCYYKLGRFGPALQLMRRFQRVVGKSVAAAYVRGAAKKIAEILRITQLIGLDVVPAGARVVLDGHPPVKAPVLGKIRLRNGQHSLLVTLAGHLTVQRSFRVGPGQPDTVKVRLRRWVDPRRRGADPERRRTRSPPPTTRPVSRGSLVWLAVAVTGTVVAVAGEGLAWGLWAAHAGGDKTDNKAFGYLYYSGHALAVVGAALAVTGFMLHFLKRPTERAERSGRFRWTPVLSAGPGGAYAGVGGTF